VKANRITAKDIAAMAGVSRPTVSRALAGDPKIKAETARRIQAIADRLGYKVNTIARSLKSGRSDVIGCIMPDLVNPFYANLVMELNRAVTEAGLKLSLSLSGGNRELAIEEISVFNSTMMDGIIWDISLYPDAAGLAAQFARGVPLLLIGGSPGGLCDHVACDDRRGGYELTRHLLELGHREVAFIGNLSLKQLGERIEGYRQALIDNEILPRESWMIDCPGLNRVPAAIDRWLRLSPRPTAIFCDNDNLAINMLGSLQSRGLRIPEDVSVAGFDNIPLASQLHLPLTTVDLCMHTFADACVALLKARIDAKREGGDWHYGAQHRLIEPRLLARATSAPRAGRKALAPA